MRNLKSVETPYLNYGCLEFQNILELKSGFWNVNFYYFGSWKLEFRDIRIQWVSNFVIDFEFPNTCTLNNVLLSSIVFALIWMSVNSSFMMSLKHTPYRNLFHTNLMFKIWWQTSSSGNRAFVISCSRLFGWFQHTTLPYSVYCRRVSEIDRERLAGWIFFLCVCGLPSAPPDLVPRKAATAWPPCLPRPQAGDSPSMLSRKEGHPVLNKGDTHEIKKEKKYKRRAHRKYS